MNKKTVYAILAALVIVLIVFLLFRLVTGLLSGAGSLILGVAVVAALVIIVVWMFAYAGIHRKK
jgi:hypothetical protein